MEYEPVQLRRHVASIPKPSASESRYWKGFKSPIYLKAHSAVDCIHFSASDPHRYAITSGARIQIYSPKTAKVVKNITRFKTNARSGHIRHDGKLVIAGDDDGLVQVFDIGSRAILRTMREHKQPVRTTLFSPPSFSSILTTSDDATVRTFDLATGSQTAIFATHVDYVRTGCFVPSSPALCLSGSYDGNVKLWDNRMPASSHEAMVMTHGYPVESVLVHPSGTMAVSAGGPLIRVWDLVSGASRCIKALSNHQKTVTCLVWDGQHQRVLSGGLDGLVKVYEAAEGSWRVGHTMRYSGQISSMAISPNNSHLIVGTVEGNVSVRKRPTVAAPAGQTQRSASLGTGTFQYGISGASGMAGTVHVGLEAKQRAFDEAPEKREHRGAGGELEIRLGSKKRRKVKMWDKYLKTFRYGDALDTVLAKQPNVNPNLVFSILLELAHRDGMHQALANRDDVGLAPILTFLLRHATDPRYAITVCDVTHIIINMYATILGQSPLIDGLFTELRRKVEDEVRFQDDLHRLQGCLDMLLVSHANLTAT